MKRIDLKFLFILIALAIVVYLATPVYASDPERGPGSDVDTNVAVTASGGGDTAVSHSSRALGLSGGDVDIAQWYRSYSYFIVYQDTKPNPLCIAQQLMAEGNYEAAAVLRCQPRTIWRPFGSKDACIAALSKAPVAVAEPEPVIDDDEDEYHEEQQELYADLLAKIEDLEQRPVQRTVVEQHGLTQEQKAELREVVGK